MPLSTAVPAAPQSADGFTAMFAAKQDQEWSGGDQVTSFEHNGFVYWLFGDSMLSNGEDADGSYPDGAMMVSNRILLQHGGDHLVNAIANAGSGKAGNGVPDAPTWTPENQQRYWTQGMFAANGHVYVLAAHMEKDPDPNSMGFKGKGVELAKYTQGSDGKLTLVAMIATPSTGVDDGVGPLKVQWSGDAVVADGYVYFYGATRAQDNPYVIHYSYVARVPVAEVENPFAWRYYASQSGTWKASVAELDQDLTNQRDAILAGQVSSVRYVGDRYVMVHKPWNGLGSDVKATSSPTPYGPWSPEVTIFSSPAGTTPGGQKYQTYSPQLHPEQPLASGKTLVSIAYNGETLADIMADADLGKPRFHEVDLP